MCVAFCATIYLVVCVFMLLAQCLLDVGDEVLYVLDTYRETDEIRGYACFAQLLVGELAVCVAGRVQHTRAGIGHVGYDANEPQIIHEADSLVA